MPDLQRSLKIYLQKREAIVAGSLPVSYYCVGHSSIYEFLIMYLKEAVLVEAPEHRQTWPAGLAIVA